MTTWLQYVNLIYESQLFLYTEMNKGNLKLNTPISAWPSSSVGYSVI